MEELVIGGQIIKPGTRTRINIDVAKLHDFTHMSMPVEVVRGKKEGPTLFVSGAIHGDEINGTEVIKRLLAQKSLKNIRGTLIAVPIVNVFGFNTKSRYLPDRRDLNRCFPGSKGGSLAAQLANTFMQEIVSKSTIGIDLHTAAIHRYNLPQIRVALEHAQPELEKLAHAFNAPVILNSEVIEGSLRAAAQESAIPILLFEGGEALRFNESVIKSALHGVLSVMKEVGMLKPSKVRYKRNTQSFVARSSHWLRAPHSGIVSPHKKIGDNVKKGELLGVVSDPFGADIFEIRATYSGIIIGITVLPLVNNGDALFHVATFENLTDVKESIDIHASYNDSQIDDIRGNDFN